jgi:hypothetical protein
VVLFSGLVSGCGNNASPTDDANTSPAPVTTSATPTPTPAPTTPAPSTPTTPPQNPEFAGFLSASAMPPLTQQQSWATGTTGPATDVPFGICGKFSMASIGASRVVERTFTSPGDATTTAAQQVVTFPDAVNAHRASKVLDAWHDSCKPPKMTVIKLGQQTDVPVTKGTGRWYLVSTSDGPESDSGTFHAFGVALSGKTMTLLTMQNDGMDYNYPAGQEPMAQAVKAASARLP